MESVKHKTLPIKIDYEPKIPSKHNGMVPSVISDIASSNEIIDSLTTITIKPNSEITVPVYIRNPLKIKGSGNDDITKLSWVTVSQTKLFCENCQLKTLIQVTAAANLYAENCTFMPLEGTDDRAIEIFANSKGYFKNCIFKNASQTLICVRDKGSIEIEDCTFMLNSSSLFVFSHSSAFVKNCIFKNTQKYGVYVYNDSKARFEGCQFDGAQGRAALVLEYSQASFSNCSFSNLMQGGIQYADHSGGDVTDSKFEKIRHPSIQGSKRSTFSVSNSSFSDSGINFDNSTGTVSDCTFINTVTPAFIALGPPSVPIIKNCIVQKSRNFAVVVRDCARPSLYNIEFIGGSTHCASISDYAAPQIAACKISQFARSAFSITNGATPDISFCSVSECKDFANIITFAHPKFTNNQITGEIFVHHNGKLEPDDFIGNYTALPPTDSKSEPSLRALTFEENHIKIGEETVKPSESPQLPETLPMIDPNNLTFHHMCDHKKQICMLCNKNESSCVCVPCGHVIVCSECRQKIESVPRPQRKPLICPLCQNTVVTVAKLFDCDKCLVCLESSDTVVLPCGHKDLCYPDAVSTYSMTQKCPECRANIVSYRHLFPTCE